MKKYLFILFFFPGISWAVNPTEQSFSISDFSGGMNSYMSPNKIPDNALVWTQNFYTDIENSCIERNGYIKRDTTSLGGQGVTSVAGLWTFVDTSGNEWAISFSSRTFYKNKFGDAPTAITGFVQTTDNEPSCTVNLGKFWCVDGTDYLHWFDGTSTGDVTGAPIGRIIVSWRTRIAIARISGSQTSIQFSGDGDGTNWTVGGLETDSFIVPFGASNDGYYIRCVYSTYLDNLIVGRKYDLWAMSGFGAQTFQTRQLSNEVGCLEQDTLKESENSLRWLSNRGVEEMQGSNIQLISEPVRNLIDPIVQNQNNDRFANLDLSNGTGTVFIDTITSPGKVQLMFPDYFTTLRDGTVGTKYVYVKDSQSGSVSIDSQRLKIVSGTDVNHWPNIRTVQKVATLNISTTFYFEVNSVDNIPITAGNYIYYGLVLTSTAPTAGSDATPGIDVLFKSTSNSCIEKLNVYDDNGRATVLDGLGIRTPFSVTFNVYDNKWQLDVRELSGSSYLTYSGTQVVQNTSVYALLLNMGPIAPCNVYIDNFGVSPQTGTYTTPAISIGNVITRWNSISLTDTLNSGSIQYQFNAASSTAFYESSWTTISDRGTPSNSTNTYAAVRATFTITAATQTPTWNSGIISWQEGSRKPTKATVYSRRYWLSFTTSTAGSAPNDTVLLFQRNRTWTVFKGINAASFHTWRDKLHFGNSNNTGYVYKFDTTNADDGSDITSQLITKSYDGGIAYREKDFRNLWTSYTGATTFSGSFSLGYTLDRDYSFSLGSANMNEGNGQVSAKFPFSLNNALQGREIQYTLTKSGTGDRLKLHDLTTKFYVKEER